MQAFTFSIDERHPSLSGHFPGNPVVPGVVLLDELLAGARKSYPQQHFRGFRQVKFLKPVLPGEQIRVHMKSTGTGINFQAYRDEDLVFSGELSCEAAEA